MRITGTYIQVPTPGESYRAFVPAPLPPVPALELTVEDHDLIERASRALGRLDGLTALLPDTSLFIYAYVRKEAVVSSQIEGTQSSFADLLLYESDQAPGVPLEDVREVAVIASEPESEGSNPTNVIAVAQEIAQSSQPSLQATRTL